MDRWWRQINYYPGEVSTPTAYLTTSELLFNSTISTLDDRFMCMDIRYFYFATPTE